MSHGDAIGDGYGIETTRHSAAGDDAGLRRIGLFVQLGVARRGVVAGRGERDERLGDIRLGDAHRIIIAAMRGAFGPNRNVTAGELGFVEGASHGESLCRQTPGRRKSVTYLG
ncbi:hypothetical protein D9M73_138570 [compost metagenome]